MTDKNEDKKEKDTGQQPEETKDKAQEYLDNWKRERADFLNYKKDEVKRLSEFAKFANEGVLLEAVELLDDLEMASQEIGDPGLNQIVKKFEEFLKKHGVERIDTEGPFDPLSHEAVSTEDGGDKTEEVRAGYTMHGKVIRPARVKIIK